jgi:hypothetical protein
MHFADVAEAEARATELGRMVAAWCTMMASGGPEAKTKAKPAIIKRAAKKT